MAEECDGTSMPLACVQRFEVGTRTMTESAERIVSIEGKVDGIGDEVALIRQAVVGNSGKGLKDTVAAHGMALKIIGAAVAIVGAAVLAAALSGCIPSSAATISARLTDVQQAVAAARTSVQDARTATEQAIGVIPADSPAQAPLKAATGHLAAADGHMGKVADAATEAQRAVPGVEDKASWFDKLTGAVVWVAVAVLAVVLLIAAWWVARRVGWLIPARTTREAELARKVFDKNDKATAREMVATKRAADPAFDRAFRKARPPPATAD